MCFGEIELSHSLAHKVLSAFHFTFSNNTSLTTIDHDDDGDGDGGDGGDDDDGGDDEPPSSSSSLMATIASNLDLPPLVMSNMSEEFEHHGASRLIYCMYY